MADLLKVNSDNLGLHTVNALFKTRYVGPVQISGQWRAKNAKEEPGAFGKLEQKMLALMKRNYGLPECEIG